MSDAGQWITLATAEASSFDVYLRRPAAPRATVVLLQEIFGVNPHMRATADRLAAEGYQVLTPDLFWQVEPHVEFGYDEAAVEAAHEVYRQFRFEDGLAAIAACIAHARRDAGGGKVGALGFCLGGSLACLAATRLAPDCSVAYYPVRVGDWLPEAPRLAAPLLIHFAALDPFTPAALRDDVARALAPQPGSRAEVYAGVDHAFHNPERPAYNAEAAALAWERSLTFLAKHLAPR